jgi:hypothetical protein
MICLFGSERFEFRQPSRRQINEARTGGLYSLTIKRLFDGYSPRRPDSSSYPFGMAQSNRALSCTIFWIFGFPRGSLCRGYTDVICSGDAQ